MGRGKRSKTGMSAVELYKAHPCYGCFHWRGETYGGTTCNYIFDQKHRRPCPPGEGCTVRRERGEAERRLLEELKKV